MAPPIGKPFPAHEKKKNALDIPCIQLYHHRTKVFCDTMTQTKLTKKVSLKRKFHGTVDKGKNRKRATPY
jgi:hypothetical protein